MRAKSYILLGAIVMMGCSAPKLNADYTIRPWLQEVEKGSIDSLFNLVGYAIEADTAEWTVASYSDAINGKITARSGGEVLIADRRAETDGRQWSLKFHFTHKPVIIIVADPDRQFYAWHQAVLHDGTPSTILSLVEQSWRNGTLRQGVWITAYGEKDEE